jgi:NADP-dependent 3-hydroxy acid dehydrogenase YdfG
MKDIQLYNKISTLPANLKREVADFVDFLRTKVNKKKIRIKERTPGLAKGQIIVHDNFDDPIEGFEPYIK